MKKMHQARLKSVQRQLRQQKIKALLVLTDANRYYLSDFSGTAGSVLVTTHTACLFVDGRYTLRAKRESELPVRESNDVTDALSRYRPGVVAVEDQIKLRDLKAMRSKHKGLRWKETIDIVESVRQQKDATELRHIKKGSAIIDDTFRHVCKIIKQKKTLTEVELAQEIERYGKAQGAQGISFEPIVAWGRNAALPHHASSAQKIGNNNFLLVDFGFTANGYQSDFTRTVFIGTPSNKQREFYETVLAAQLQAIEAIQMDSQASAVDKAARTYLSQHGYGEYFTHTTGHGVGVEIHELPTLSSKSRDKLPKNSVITIEPGAYFPNQYGVRIEDMVVVGQKPKIFSNVPKDWESMVITRSK